MAIQELSIQREQTTNYINANPTDIALTRYTRTSDGAGGTTATGATLDPQTFRVVAQSSAARTTERRTVSGAMVNPDIILVCQWDANIERGDSFDYNGIKMQVVWITDLQYEKLAEVAVF